MPRPSSSEILAELRGIRKELRSLREELALRTSDQVAAMFRRRGFTYMGGSSTEKLVLPPDARFETEDALYGLLQKYSFRLFLRDVIKQNEPFTAGKVGKYSSTETVRRYLAALLSHKVLKKKSRRYSLVSPSVYSFGDTFEWYVSNIFTREYLCPAEWGVKLKELKCGGDLDVVALVDGRFVYVEAKSSPPKHVEQNEISAFFDRLLELRPDAAIFLEDTRLRMKDKIVVMFEAELKRRWPDVNIAVERMKGELFKVGDKLFIVNSKPDVASNLAYCLGKVLSAPVVPP